MPELRMEPWDELHNIEVCHFELEREDIYHLKNLYKLVHDWLDLNNFRSLEDDDEKVETFYMEKRSDNKTSEHLIWWRAQHIPKGNNYYKYFLKIDQQTLYVGSSEITHKGQKLKTNKGDITFRVRAWLMLDYKREWRDHSILGMFDHFFIKRMFKKQVDFLREDLWIKVYNLNDTIKNYLKLKSRHEMTKSFHPELGV